MHIFDYDSGLSVLLRKCVGCVALGLLWLICMILVIPGGAGSAALYDGVNRHIIKEEGNLFPTFWDSFRENFKAATTVWLVVLGLGAFLCWDFYYFWQLAQAGDALGLLWIVTLLTIALLLLTAVYALSYTTRFEDKPLRILKNAFILALSHPLVNLKLIFIGLLLILTGMLQPMLLLLLPGFACWMICQSMEKLFQRLIEK